MQPLLALFARSLREHTRNNFTYWIRAGIAAAIMGLILSNQRRFAWDAAPGRTVFEMVTTINCFLIVLAALSSFCSVITEEKEDETLGLLRMTNLSPLAILLGKSTSRLCLVLLLLVVQVPFTLLAITMGGVSLPQILATYLVLFSVTFFLCNVALFWSVACRNTLGAVASTLIFGLIIYALFPALHAEVEKAFRQKPSEVLALQKMFLEPFTRVNPMLRLNEIRASGFGGSLTNLQFWSHLVGGIVFFAGSLAIFNRAADRAVHGDAGARKDRRRRTIKSRPGKWALAWKDYQYFLGGVRGLFLRLGIYLVLPLLIIVVISWKSEIAARDVGDIFLGAGLMCMSAELLIGTNQMFGGERKWKTLSSLVVSPWSVRKIIFQKFMGTLPIFFPSLLLLIIGTYFQPIYLTGFLDEVKRMWDRDRIIFQVLSYFGLQLFLLSLLIVEFSLSLRKGAVPVAISTLVGFNFVFFILMNNVGYGMQESTLNLVICLMYVAIFVLIRRLFILIPRVASED